MEPASFSPYLRLIQKTGATKHPYGFSATDQILKRIGFDTTKRVLDVGCGAGHTSAYVAKNYDCQVTGVDFSADAVERARALHSDVDVNFVVGDVLHLPFADGEFDVVMCESVLFFVQDKAAALAEMSRVVKPGGHLSLNELIVANTDGAPMIQNYFSRPEFGGFLVTAELMRESLDGDWAIIMEDEKPFDILQHLKAELKHLFSFTAVLPIFEMAHLAWADKATRDDLISVVKFMMDMPKGVLDNLNSYLLLAQKKPLG